MGEEWVKVRRDALLAMKHRHNDLARINNALQERIERYWEALPDEARDVMAEIDKEVVLV